MRAFTMFFRSNSQRIVTVGIAAQADQKLKLMQNISGSAGLIRLLRLLVPTRKQGSLLWYRSLNRATRDAWISWRERDTARATKVTTEVGARSQGAATGQISLVGAGPGARDLLTLRAVERLKEADVIFYDRLVDEEVLELTRRDAKRVFVGKQVGAHAWPQEQINQMIVEEACRGNRVVRLKSGDPGIFGRATEEIDAAHAAGIRVDIVPGVTAAMAAAAALGKSLTRRDVADVLVLATGTGCKSDPVPDTTRMTGPGTTTVIYMGVRHAARLQANLLERGLPADAPVGIAVEVSKAGQKNIETTLASLEKTITDNCIRGCAVIIVTWPKQVSCCS